MTTKRKAKLGRPSNGIDEVRILVPMPALLAGVAEELARREGISRAEWIRRAMRVRLGWGQVVQASEVDSTRE